MSTSGGGLTAFGGAATATGTGAVKVTGDVPVVGEVTTGNVPVAMDCDGVGVAAREAVPEEGTVGVTDTIGVGEVTSCATAARYGVMTDGVSTHRFFLRTTGAGSVGFVETGVDFLVVCMGIPFFVDGLDFVACGFGSGCFKLHLRAVWTEARGGAACLVALPS